MLYNNVYWLCIDTEKQNAINLFLGLFCPNENEPAIWEQNFDYYLHHPETTSFLSNDWLIVIVFYNFLID